MPVIFAAFLCDLFLVSNTKVPVVTIEVPQNPVIQDNSWLLLQLTNEVPPLGLLSTGRGTGVHDHTLLECFLLMLTDNILCIQTVLHLIVQYQTSAVTI